MPPTILNADGSLNPRLVDQSLRELRRQLRALPTPATKPPVAPLTGSGPVTTVDEVKQLLQAGSKHPLNVQGLLGVLAEPQLPGVTVYTAIPTVTLRDAVLQDTVLIRVGTKLYVVAGTSIVPVGGITGNPCAFAYNNANQSIPNNAETLLAYNTTQYDTDLIHTGGFTGRLTATTPGKYAITLNLAFAQNNTGIRFGSIRLNGSTLIGAYSTKAIDDGATRTFVSVATEYVLAAGDYVDSTAYQNSGGALNVEFLGREPNFAMTLISG